MKVNEVATYLEISPQSVYKLAKEGKIISQKVGRCLEFNEEDIYRWQEEKNQSASRQPNKEATRQQVVKAIKICKPLKEVRLDDGTTLILPRSAWVVEGDQVELTQNSAWVICKNGYSQIFPFYLVREQLQVGGLKATS